MNEISFHRLPEIPASEIADHMSDPRLVEHMPLLSGTWDIPRVEQFVAMKEAHWAKDGLEH